MTLVLLVLLACGTNPEGRAQVYSVRAYSGGKFIEHQWLIGTPANCFGYTQYKVRLDSQGRIVSIVDQPPDLRLVTYTVIHFGTRNIRMPVPAWIVATCGIVTMGLAAWIVRSFVPWKRSRPLADAEHKGRPVDS